MRLLEEPGVFFLRHATHAEVSGSLVNLQPSGVRIPEHALQVRDFLCKCRVRARVKQGVQSFLDEFKVGLAQFMHIHDNTSVRILGAKSVGPPEGLRHQMETFMNLKLIVAILAIAFVSVCAQAQQPSGAKVKADVQNVVKIISGDKAKTQTYCQIDELSDQVTQAAQKKDNKKVEELSRQIDELEGRLGPEYLALAKELEEVDPNSQDGQEISSAIDALDQLCVR